MPKDNPPRWITVRKPFDYKWPGRTAITSYGEAHLGEHMVKAEVADYAVANGFATEGKADGSDATAPKGQRRTRAKARSKSAASKATSPAKPAKTIADAAPDNGPDPAVAGTDLPAPDSAGAGGAVDSAAE